MVTPSTDPIHDELLAVRCQLGEPEAFDELAVRWHGPLWTYVRRLAADEDRAREIVQDVWVRILRGLPGLRDGSKLRAWLFGIARRTLMDRLRDRYARPVDADVDPDSLPADPGAGGLEDDLEALEGSLERLPIVEREVLTLFYLRELSLEDVASALDVPVGTVKSRLYRARRMLRAEMTTERGGSR